MGTRGGERIYTIAEYHALLRGAEQRALPPSRTGAPAPDRYRSDTERRYAALLAAWVADGTLRRWWYEPCKGLFLTATMSYTPDFLLEYPDGSTVFHETKGAHIYAKDWQKAKQAAARYPCWPFWLAQWKSDAWHWRRIPSS